MWDNNTIPDVNIGIVTNTELVENVNVIVRYYLPYSDSPEKATIMGST
jgi:hypothetical protein